MRYLLGLICVLALGVMGCSESPPPPECEADADCDDQNECTRDECHTYFGSCGHFDSNIVECDFNGVDEVIEDGFCIFPELVCEKNPCDDGNECTWDDGDSEACYHGGCTGCQPCDWDGEPGVCIDGVCEEDRCPDLVCDDGDLCTEDTCRANECHFTPKNCDDHNRCTNDSCEPETGDCVHEPVPVGASCCYRGGDLSWLLYRWVRLVLL